MENIEKEQANTTPPAAKKNRKFFWVIILLLSLIISSVFGAVFGFVSGGLSQVAISRLAKKYPEISKALQKLDGNEATSEITKQRIIQEDSAVIDVVEKATPSVVSIVISKEVSNARNNFNPFGDDLFNYFFGFEGDSGSGGGQPEQNSSKQTIGMGTGFIASHDGMIITNRHVVEDASADYTVITNDDKEYPAKILAKDPINDIALIKIEGADFPILSFGDSENLKIGQTVIAIGNSLGEFSNTVSRGIISGLKRNLTASSGFGESENLRDIIQTDAAINLGNSGGPLLDINGEVIGINVAKAQGAENIGFAIPSNQIKKIIDQINKEGKISVPYIGVRYIPVDAQIQKENNLPYSYGALVLRGSKITDFAVIPGGPADKAGIVENDIILEINGTKADSKNDLVSLVAKYNVGDRINLKIWHRGEEKMVQVMLEERI